MNNVIKIFLSLISFIILTSIEMYFYNSEGTHRFLIALMILSSLSLGWYAGVDKMEGKNEV